MPFKADYISKGQWKHDSKRGITKVVSLLNTQNVSKTFKQTIKSIPEHTSMVTSLEMEWEARYCAPE